MAFSVIVVIAPCEYFHWFPYNPLAVITKMQSKTYRVNNPYVSFTWCNCDVTNSRFLDSGCTHLRVVTFYALMVHSRLRFVTRLWFISIGWTGISNAITKTGAQPILEHNGNRKRNDNRITRMHSSRMRTGRSLTVCCSLLPGGVLPGLGGLHFRGGLPGPRGFLPGPKGGSPWQGDLPGPGGLPCPGLGSPWQGEVPPCEQNDRHV